MPYLAIVNVPGYLPETDDDEPTQYETPREAWYALYHERNDAESEFPCPLCGDTMTHGVYGDCDDDSEEAQTLATMARANEPGTVYLSTPGYDGTHDLGLAYSVVIAEV